MPCLAGFMAFATSASSCPIAARAFSTRIRVALVSPSKAMESVISTTLAPVLESRGRYLASQRKESCPSWADSIGPTSDTLRLASPAILPPSSMAICCAENSILHQYY